MELFVRSDSETLWLGLETAPWTSLVSPMVAAIGAVTARTRVRY